MADVNLRLPRRLYDDYVDFCTLVRRDQADVAREIFELFFAEGFRVAFERLRTGKWPLRTGGEADLAGIEAAILRSIADDESKADPE